MYCTSCGNTNWADLRYCPGCGRDIHPEREAQPEPTLDLVGHVGQVGYAEESAIGVLAPDPAAPTEAGTGRTRRRWIFPVAGLLVVLLGAGAGWSWWRSAHTVPDDDIIESVSLTEHPQVRWTRTLHDWDADCIATAIDAAGSCSVQTVALTDDRMVMLVLPNSAAAQLVAVDLSAGSVSWRHSFAKDGAVVCTSNRHGTGSGSTDAMLWCLTGEKSRSADQSDDDMRDEIPTSVDAPGSLTALSVQSGSQTGSSDLRSSAGEYAFAGARPDAVFVTTFAGYTKPSSSTTETADGDSFNDSFNAAEDTLDGYQVIKYSASAATQWSTVIAGSVKGVAFNGQVTSIGGVDYLVGATDDSGKGLGLRDDDGTAVSVEAGAVMGGYQGKVVTDGSSLRPVRGLAVDGYTVPGDLFAGYGSTDGSVTPLLTSSNFSSSGAVTSQILASTPPYVVRHQFAGLAGTVCDGKIFVSESDDNSTTEVASLTIRALDADTGATSWQISNSSNPSTICAGQNVVMQDQGMASDTTTTTTLAGYSVENGRRQWLLTTRGVFDVAGVTGIGIVLTTSQIADNDAGNSTFAYVH